MEEQAIKSEVIFGRLPEDRDIFNIDEVATFLGVNHSTIRNYIRGGQLEANRAGPRLVRIERAAIMSLLIPIKPGEKV